MKPGWYDKYIAMNLADSVAGPIFKEYNELFGRYPKFLLDLSEEEQMSIIKRNIREEKERRKKE